MNKIFLNLFLLTISLKSYSVDMKPIDMIDGPLKEFHELEIVSKMNHRFDKLPLSASLVDQVPGYSYGYQWYHIMGGINYNHFTFGMSPLKKLNTILESSDSELEVKPQKSILNSWEGLCNGVANLHSVATIPDKDREVLLKDGRSVILSKEDIHAMVSLAMTKTANALPILGARCNFRGRDKKWCLGLNPAVFHLSLANELGLKKSPIIIDSERFKKVNNIPVYAYEMNVLGESKEFYKNSEYSIYEIEVSITTPQKVSFLNRNITESKMQISEYRYQLYVDQQNRIKGGSWISDARPDFMWFPTKSKLEGKFSFLNKFLIWRK